MQFSRLELLVEDKIELIKNKTVLVVGIGGVGGYVVEALARSGIGTIIIVDNDIVDISNLNRQIISLHSNIGKYKVDVLESRIKDINPNCKVIKFNTYLTKDNTIDLFDRNIDYVVDACDTITVKFELIKICNKKSIKLISSMGTGNKFDPSLLKIVDIKSTSYDPVAKILRELIKKENIKTDFKVVCSTEKPKKIQDRKIGSTPYVPGVAGLLCASYVINDIVR